MRVNNESQYDLFIEKISWQIVVGLKNGPSVKGVASGAFLLLPQTVKDNVLLREFVDYAEARYVSHVKQGLVSQGYIEGTLMGRVRQSHIEKRFLISSVPCLVEEKIGPAFSAHMDPSHLDPLSGLLNQKFLTDNMQMIVNMASPHQPISFVMIDVDVEVMHSRLQSTEKKASRDFAVWKFSKDAIGWESPWGKGYPGWHIECSVMAMHYLGKTIDIHTGGQDHIPIHHNNEIAQSESATGRTFAKIWMHNAFVNISGGKMAKSDENFITLSLLKKKGTKTQSNTETGYYCFKN